MRELPNEEHPFQAKMKEWFEANQEIYSKFKDKIQSVLKNSLYGNDKELIDDEMAALQSAILEVLDKEDGTLDELTERFTAAIKDGNVFACCLYCYLEQDNGLEEIADAMMNLELSAGAKDIKDGIKVYLQDKRRETQEAVSKDLNLLGLRRWHYDHPKDYQEFTEWMETNGTDSILAYLFAALTSCNLLNDSYNYRTFHTAILEKFPDFGFKSGFDWAEALYNAIINEYGYDYNLSLSEKTVTKGKEQANLIGIRLRTLLSLDVY